MVRTLLLLFVASSLSAQVGEIRQVTESWENGGKNTVVGELLTVLSVTGGYRYERSNGDTIWSNASQFNNKTILYGTAPPVDPNDSGSSDNNGSSGSGGTTTTTTTQDGDVSVTVNVTTPEVNIPEVDLTEITSLISQLDTNDDYDELVSIVGVLENNYDYLTTDQQQQLVDLNNKLIEIRDNLTLDLNDIKTKSQKNLDYLEELNATYLELDRDNDLPMLTQIYDKIFILEEKNNENLINIYDRQLDIAGEISDRETELTRMTEFADIENSLRILETEVLAQRGTLFDENGSERLATLADIVNAINGENNETNASIEPDEGFDDIDDQKDETDAQVTALLENYKSNAELTLPRGTDAPTKLEMGAGQYTFYVDPFQNLSSHGSLLSNVIDWSEVTKWVSLMVGLVCGVIWFQACARACWELLGDLMKSEKSANVTDLTVAGTSIGTLILKRIKRAIVASLLGSSGVLFIFVLLESGFEITLVSGLLSATSIQELSDAVSAQAGQIHSGFSLATSIFLDLVPIGSISIMVASYWGLVLTAKSTLTTFMIALQAKS